MNSGLQELRRLTSDHDVFRLQMDVLDAAMGLGPRAGPVLRDLARELFGKLRAHARRESCLAVTVSRRLKRIDGAQLAKFAIEHDVALETLRVIRRSLPMRTDQELGHLRPALRMLGSNLRRHMDDQERLLFPMLEHELAASESEQTTWPVCTAEPVAYALARSLGLLNPLYGRASSPDRFPSATSS